MAFQYGEAFTMVSRRLLNPPVLILALSEGLCLFISQNTRCTNLLDIVYRVEQSFLNDRMDDGLSLL